ncbi:sulfatase-like hydrolase/transferase [Legionella waltersii]|uniref:Putative Sulfatase n=1 Tax=Legionella waltersii TaxID=66969 RepID=A0A0W1AJN7_9GAMM|nr:sulfatase-like hydrolase/transferase [Legionella waltersii]KTD81594.1 putative Sulfatase [Legionella waltersii]SNV13170.1 putative Sulfatase [Legionella waltersii]
MDRTNSIKSYFFQFLLFNFCFFALQTLLLYSRSEGLINSIPLPWSIYLEIAETITAQFSLYVILSLIQTLFLFGVLNRAWSNLLNCEQWQLTIWTLFVICILSANTCYFPLSQFSKLISPPIPNQVFCITFYISLGVLGLLLVNTLCYRYSLRLVSFLVPIIGILWLIDFFSKPKFTPKEQTRPNIILLGIDSLSPESIKQKNMPFLSGLLKNSLRFTNTISPLARTFPAWSSILTGLYPKHHGADENLVERKRVKSNQSIVWELDRLGYNTIYATDDRRFNSIDEKFGFKQIIGPKTGVNDVILGSYNDFPLGNLLINLPISAWLFPYNYSNRASYFSYYPTTFNQLLEKELSANQNYPVFLAVHFALPHWPYAWASSSPDQVNNEFSLSKRDGLYQSALKAVDKQFESFFTFLKMNGYLKNSLLIILSDHGEVLFYPNSRLTNYQHYQSSLSSRLAEYLQSKTATVLDKSAGHGSDILSPKQYHCLLAFNIYQNDKLTSHNKKIMDRIALFDLAPTILDFVSGQSKYPMDGISLLPAITQTEEKLPARTFFIESGMYPNQEFSKDKAIELGHKLFMVNPLNGQLEVKPHELININNNKLYGIIKGNWILALYPDDNDYIPIIQNLVTLQWVDNLDSAFAKKTPAQELLNDLKQFYGHRLMHPIQ